MAPASASPSLRAYSSRDTSPSPRQIPLSVWHQPAAQRLPHVPPVQTHINGGISAPNVSSITASPYLASIQSSPIVPLTQSHLSNPVPLELPESVVMSSPLSGSTKDSSTLSKSGSLMRKLSQSAKDGVSTTRQIIRRKASSSNQSRREESTGPIARRRSDSKTLNANGVSVDQAILDTFNSDLQSGLAIFDAMSISSEPITLVDTSPEGVAPTVPDRLVLGCTLWKVTKNSKLVPKTFHLDHDGSRIYWKGAVTTKSFYIDNIKSIRTGKEAASYQKEIRDVDIDPERCFTINYAASDSSKSTKTLHLVAESRDVLNLWDETLKSISKHREEMMSSMMGSTEREFVIRKHWDKEISKQDQKLDPTARSVLNLNQVQSLCQRLHIHCPTKTLQEFFDKADVDHTGFLDYDQFKEFLRQLRYRQDIRRIFKDLKDPDTNGITRSQFKMFLTNIQGLDLTGLRDPTAWEDKIDHLVSMSFIDNPEARGKSDIDFNAFTSFIVSQDCHVHAKEEEQLPKFDRPLNEYFISSSHNTYLTGWQVAGTSSAEAYITAIRHGCRCVEVDCWNGQDGNPRVTHGHTKTSAVLFSDCINAISRCAFDMSPYPLIISLEVHCDVEQQRKMVDIMMDVFGSRLLVMPLDESETKLPSPEELKYKILIKVKATQLHADLAAVRASDRATRKRSASSPYRRPTNYSSSSMPPVPALPGYSMTSPTETIISSPTDRSMTATSASSAEESDSHLTSPTTPSSQSRKMSKVIPELSRLGVYAQGYTLRDYRDLAFKQYNHIFSLNETKAMDLCQPAETKALFEDHNLKYLCRVYPKNMRFQSSNFDPNTFWRRGVQMVALNWQTYDAHMQMNQAMFAAGTDQYGYVLKPEYLRKPRTKPGDFEHRVKLPRFKMEFSVNIISAQQLPRPQNIGKNEVLNPYIEVQMFSAEDKARGIADGKGGQESTAANSYHGIGMPYRRRTNVVLGNGYNPQFNETIKLSLHTKYPELVFVRFIVFNCPDGRPNGKERKQIAVFTSKLSSLQSGYRHLPLFNGNGEEFIFSTLFCQISKSDPQFSSSSLQDLAERTSRPSLFRGMFPRGLSGDRGRDRGRDRSTSIEEQRAARQEKLNREIEERFAKQ